MTRICVIGAGVIGLASALRLAEDGHTVTVFDRAPEGDKCSWGNAGGIAVTEVVPASVPGLLWRLPKYLFDPLGPLALHPAHAPFMATWGARFLRAGRASEAQRVAAALAALLQQVYGDLVPLLDALGLASCLHRDGALTVYEHAASLERDAAEWALKRAHGIACHPLTGDEARALEPALGPNINAAMFTPSWSHVSDPKRIWRGLVDKLRAIGTPIATRDVRRIGGPGEVITETGSERFDAVVVAAGAWSAILAKSAGDHALLESERGYNTTIAQPGVALGREVIFAERKFVATPLEIGLRIGGAAEFAGLRRPANLARAAVLARLAQRYLPNLATSGGVAWMGQRPTTPDSLPVIGRSPRRPDLIYAFGHGHLGLTLAATTGAIIADVVAGRDPGLDLAPYSIARF